LKVTRSVAAPRPPAARAPSAPARPADAPADDEPPWFDDEPPPWDMEMDDGPASPPPSTPAGQGGGREQAALAKPNGNGRGNGRGNGPGNGRSNGHPDSRSTGSAPSAVRSDSLVEPPAASKAEEPAAVVAPAVETAAPPQVAPAPGGSETAAVNGNGGRPPSPAPSVSNGKRSPLEPARPAPASNGNGGAAAPSAMVQATREQPLAYVAPRQKVIVTFYGTGDKDRDARVMRRAHGLLTSYSGQDEFEFVIYEEGIHGCQVRFPNDSTGYCEALAQQLSTLLGPGCVEVSSL